MSRKRQAEPESDESDVSMSSEDSLSSDSEASSDDGSSGDEEETINCDFEFFDPQKQDFLGIRHLLRQLFDADADLFDLGALSEMILAQPLVGSTVKTDGHEGDPLAFLTVLNLRVHQDNPVIQTLVKYLLDKSKSKTKFYNELSNLLDGKTGDVGLVLSERIVNIPPAVTGPNYKMLLEEIQWAIDDKEPYDFSHFLILSRTYVQDESESGDENEAQVTIKPRTKKQKRQTETETQYFHPEDELFLKSAEHVSFLFTNREGSEEPSFKTSGLLMLIERSKLEESVRQMELYLGIPEGDS